MRILLGSSRSHKTILLVFPTVPYPLRVSGISLRYLPVIQYLSCHHVVDVIVVVDNERDSKRAEALKQYCRRVSTIPNPKFNYHSPIEKLWVRSKLLLPWTPPISYVVYGGQQIADAITKLTSQIAYDSVVWVTAEYSPYLNTAFGKRIIIDFIDSPSLCADRNVMGSAKAELLRKYECWKIRRWEAKLIGKATASVYVSSVDALYAPARLTRGSYRHAIPNGISVDSYNDALQTGITPPSIGFIGNMAYSPNVEAAQWLFEKVFLPLRAELPNLSLRIIGREPTDPVLKLGRHEGVTVTGAVEDIWPHINSVDVFICPLWRGAGIKNKILEVMYASRPVITSSIGNEGIAAVPGRDLLVCNTPEEFRREALRVLRCPEVGRRLGQCAHEFVTKRFAWSHILKEFEDVITGTLTLGSSSCQPVD